MAQDIRNLFERERQKHSSSLPEGHEVRFLQKLEQALPQERKRRIVPIWIRYAAASVALVCIAYVAYTILSISSVDQKHPSNIVEQTTPIESTPQPPEEAIAYIPVEEQVKENTKTSTNSAAVKHNTSPRESAKKTELRLADLSPDLKKVEAFFISSINAELANLQAGPEEQEMVDAYLIKVKELGKEYENLTKELNTIGVNDMTISALIENLKLRLQLLQRLKKNLNHLKNESNDKDSSSNI